MSNKKRKIIAENEFMSVLVDNGYKQLSEYINNRTKIKLECPEGHIFVCYPLYFKKMVKCPACSGKCPNHAKSEFITMLSQDGYTLLSGYIGSLSNSKLMCSKGHVFEMRPNNFKMGHRCPRCAGLCKKQAEEHLMEMLSKENYITTSTYINTYTKIKLKCPNDHIWSVSPNEFKSGNRCPHCSGSTGQRLLQQKLEDYDLGEVVYNDRTTLNGLELDIYYPEIKLAIEYQGNYWHSLPDHIERDLRKKQLCGEMGILLVEVWDNDFIKDGDIVVCNILNTIEQRKAIG